MKHILRKYHSEVCKCWQLHKVVLYITSCKWHTLHAHLFEEVSGTMQVKSASHQAGVSTASMGKFDKRLPNEKEGERQPGTKRQQFMPVTDNKGTERSNTSAVADSILRARADDVLDVRHAIGKIETEKRDKRSKARGNDDRDDSQRVSRGRGGRSDRGASRGGRGGASAMRGGRGDRGRSSGRGGRVGSSRGGSSRGGSSRGGSRGGSRGSSRGGSSRGGRGKR